MTRTTLFKNLINNLRLDSTYNAGGSSFKPFEYNVNNERTIVERLNTSVPDQGNRLTTDETLHDNNSRSKSRQNIIVLGAGLSGLTAAYYLKKAGFNCSIYEARSNLGGRIQTSRGFNKDNMHIELGAEFVDLSHKELQNLCHELGVPTEKIRLENNILDNIFIHNGKVIDTSSFSEELEFFAKLIKEDQNSINGPNHIFSKELNKFINLDLDNISLEEYLCNKKSLGFSDEFIDYVRLTFVSLMGVDTSNQNTYNLINLIKPNINTNPTINGELDSSIKIIGGNSSIISKLYEKIKDSVEIYLEHELLKIKDLGTAFRLDFSNGNSSNVTKTADLIINTLPIPTLRHVEGINSLDLSQSKKTAINKIGYSKSAKYSIGFEKQVWKNEGNLIPPNSGIIRNNKDFVEIIDSTGGQRGTSGILLNYVCDKDLTKLNNIKGMTLNYLETLYPGITKIFDGNEKLTVWSDCRFSMGSYVCPSPSHYSNMCDFDSQVELNGRMIFAGDCFSKNYSGYMNGAVETGKKAAEIVSKVIK